jgi:hypothetical protein
MVLKKVANIYVSLLLTIFPAVRLFLQAHLSKFSTAAIIVCAFEFRPKLSEQTLTDFNSPPCRCHYITVN